MASLLSNALKTAAIGGMIGFGVGMVSGMVKKKATTGPTIITPEIGEEKDPEIEYMGHRLHDYGDSRQLVQYLYELTSMETSELTMALPQEAHSLKHKIEIELGTIVNDTADDRQDKLKEIVKEVMDVVDEKVKTITFDVQEQMD
tara:strand:+ start:153 stop:587 length:435 start_codon:yes stop_codon:yes gene_type:complete